MHYALRAPCFLSFPAFRHGSSILGRGNAPIVNSAKGYARRNASMLKTRTSITAAASIAITALTHAPAVPLDFNFDIRGKYREKKIRRSLRKEGNFYRIL